MNNNIKPIDYLLDTPLFISSWPTGDRFLEFQQITPNRIVLHVFGTDPEPFRIGHPFIVDLVGEYATCPRIADVDPDRSESWEIIDMGGQAVIYRIAPGVVAKVGKITPAEAQAQAYFARQLKALPVWDYVEECCELFMPLASQVCPIHGVRRDILDIRSYICTCFDAPDVLLMPEAETSVDTDSDEYQAFIIGFSRDCEQQLGHYWDARPGNVVRYLGSLVALDFGEEG